MTTKAKAVNFTEQQALDLKIAFLAMADNATAETQKAIVTEFASRFGKGTRSIVAKASNMGVYRKFKAVTKTGAVVETKADIVTKIAKKFDLSEAVIASLESATKQALLEILAIPVITSES